MFPNARVDLTAPVAGGGPCVARSYFVTDGGATENLGLISALVAIEGALGDPRLRSVRLDLHFVLAEASALGYDYAQDRGVSVATGDSKERLAGGLTLELRTRVVAAATAADPDSHVAFHDLSLPRVFRSRGGFGTHWMFPDTIRITTPQPEELPLRWQQLVAQASGQPQYRVAIGKSDLLDLWSALYPHGDEPPFCELQDGRRWPSEALTVARWICGVPADGGPSLTPDPQPQRWADLRSELARSHQPAAGD